MLLEKTIIISQPFYSSFVQLFLFYEKKKEIKKNVHSFIYGALKANKHVYLIFFLSSL